MIRVRIIGAGSGTPAGGIISLRPPCFLKLSGTKTVKVLPSSLGVALLVMLPLLYTDVSDSWRLASRRQRLAIGIAGVATELGLAMVATLLWSFLLDGPLRSAAFLVATTTWVSTLAIHCRGGGAALPETSTASSVFAQRVCPACLQ